MTTTSSKIKSKKITSSLASMTNDNTQTRVLDLSSGKPLIQVTVPQIISAIIFVFGLGWFIASQWIFETRSEKLKGEINNNLNNFKQEMSKNSNWQELKVNEHENKIENIENSLKDLKQRNSYLK